MKRRLPTTMFVLTLMCMVGCQPLVWPVQMAHGKKSVYALIITPVKRMKLWLLVENTVDNIMIPRYL